MLTKEAILGANDLPVEKLSVPEWGGHVFIRTISGTERDGLEQWWSNNRKSLKNVRAHLAAITICDESGALLFTPMDIQALGEKSALALSRVFNKACEQNGLTKKDVDTLAGNSDDGQSDSSITD